MSKRTLTAWCLGMGVGIGVWSLSAWAKGLSIQDVLHQVYDQNPELAVQKAQAEVEEAAIASKYSLSNPRVGFMSESNLTSDQRLMGDMQSWTVSQELLFPTKYFSRGAAQRAKARSAWAEYLDKRLSIRQKALSQYYAYYSASRIAALREAQRETLREIARIVETRRATGAVPQQDEMKVHVEQTRLENEILLQTQEVTETQALLNALLNQDALQELELPSEELRIPKLKISSEDFQKLAQENSKMLVAQVEMVQEAETEKTVADMGYLPDFMVNYRRPFGANAPANAYAIGVEISIPLWFFANQVSEAASASAKVVREQKRLELTRRQIGAEVKSLGSKTETLAKLLKIYETALIPQATSALNASRAAYRAGRVQFHELLDAERSLYDVRIGFYQNLAKFVEALTALERMAGISVSDLPMEGETS